MSGEDLRLMCERQIARPITTTVTVVPVAVSTGHPTADDAVSVFGGELKEVSPTEVTFPAQHRGCGGVMAPVVFRIPGRGDGIMCTRCRKWRRAPAGAFEKGVEV
jgi:hypothetical protein